MPSQSSYVKSQPHTTTFRNSRTAPRVRIFGTEYELREHLGLIEHDGARCLGVCKPIMQRLIISSATPSRRRDAVVMALVIQAAEYELARRGMRGGAA